LNFIKDRPQQIINEFVKIAIQFIKKGANQKLYGGAARTLGVDVKQIEGVVQAIAHLFGEASRYFITEADFIATVVLLGFSKELCEQLKEVYLENRDEIRKLQQAISFDLPHYQNLDWRLDIQLSSRCLRNQITPLFTLRLDTIENGESKSQIIQADYTNIKNLTEELERALKESKSAYTRRIMRNVK